MQWGDLEPSQRPSETGRNIHRSRADRCRVGVAQRDWVRPFLLSKTAVTSNDGAHVQPCGFGKDGVRTGRRRPSGRRPAGLWRRAGAGRARRALEATQVLQEPAARNILSGTSTDPLDDPISIFGSTSLSPSAPIPSAAVAPAVNPLGGFGMVSPATETPSTPSNQQKNFLGLFYREPLLSLRKKWNLRSAGSCPPVRL